MFTLSPLASIVLLVASMLAGCAGKDADASLASAKAFLANGDLKSAVIELKSTLQAQPSQAEARFLYGKTLLDLEDPAGAAIELGKARELKFDDERVAPQLAVALLQSGKMNQVVELDRTTTLKDPDAVAMLKMQAASAHAMLGTTAKADAAVASALAAKPDHAPALLYRARASAWTGDLEAAMKIVDGILVRAPASPEALTFKGQLVQQDAERTSDAAALYRQALAATPDFVPAHAALLKLYLAKDDLEEAQKQLEALAAVRPRHFETAYFRARIAMDQGDLKAANDLTQQLIRVAPERPEVLQLAGIMALRNNEFLRAEQLLVKLVQVRPHSFPARRLLARTYLRTGEPAKVLATLNPILASGWPDAEALALAGTAHMMAGDSRRAQELLARAAKLRPEDTATRIRLAQMKAGSRSSDDGLAELDSIAESDPGTTADLELISAAMRRGDWDGALKAVARMEKKQPGRPEPLHLRGQVLLLRGDLAGARANFEKALALDESYFPSIDRLAVLDLRDGKPELARARFEAVLRANPQNVLGVLGLAALGERTDRPKQEIADLIARAVTLRPHDGELRRRLVLYQLARRDAKAAMAAAQSAVTAIPDSPDVIDALARAQFSAGDSNQALRSYTKLASMTPQSAEPYLGLARVNTASGNLAEAKANLGRALELVPGHPEANQRALALSLQAGDYEAAERLARLALARDSKLPLGHQMLGDVHARRGRWAPAIAAYRTAHALQPSTISAQRLHGALVSAGQSSEADSFVQTWTKSHPTDPGFLFHLASLAMKGDDLLAAERYLRATIAIQPDNALALNNLAWTLGQLKRPGSIEFAERANALEQDQPVYMDTLAMLLADDKQVDRALDLQRRAVALAPNLAPLRLGLARLLIAAGDKTAAAAELNRLDGLDGGVPKSAINALRKTL